MSLDTEARGARGARARRGRARRRASVLAFTGSSCREPGSVRVVRVKFGRALLLIAVVAFGVRVAYVALRQERDVSVVVAGTVVPRFVPERVRGRGPALLQLRSERSWPTARASWSRCGRSTTRARIAPPAADHPPLTVLVLAPVSWLVERPPSRGSRATTSTRNVREHRYTMVLLGTLLVVLVGLLGRRVGRRRGRARSRRASPR